MRRECANSNPSRVPDDSIFGHQRASGRRRIRQRCRPFRVPERGRPWLEAAHLGLLPPGNPPQSPQNRPNCHRRLGKRNPTSVKLVPDALAIGERALVFPKAKDRPVVITALAAEAAVLLTLDRTDFHRALGREIYGMKIRTPADFLVEQRKAGLF